MSLTKADMTEHLITNLGISKQDAKQLVDNFFETIAETLVQGQSLKIAGLGNFDLRDKAARPGMNPKTKEKVIVSARRVVTFKASQKLKDQVSEAKKS